MELTNDLIFKNWTCLVPVFSILSSHPSGSPDSNLGVSLGPPLSLMTPTPTSMHQDTLWALPTTSSDFSSPLPPPLIPSHLYYCNGLTDLPAGMFTSSLFSTQQPKWSHKNLHHCPFPSNPISHCSPHSSLGSSPWDALLCIQHTPAPGLLHLLCPPPRTHSLTILPPYTHGLLLGLLQVLAQTSPFLRGLPRPPFLK